MRILFLGLAVPNMDEYHNMYTELMVEFREQGHEVVIVGPAYDAQHTGLQQEDGFQVLRVAQIKGFGPRLIRKGLTTVLMPYTYKRALKRSGIDLNFDLLILPTPPITLTVAAQWLKRKTGLKVYLVLRDIFPQNAVDLGMMRPGSLLFKHFRRTERALYKVSDFIGCMSAENMAYIRRHNPEVDPEKLHLLPNWGVKNDLLPSGQLSEVKARFGLEGKFVVLFGGNIGKPQKMENVLALAEACSEIDDMLFLIVGGGVEKARLDREVTTRKMANVVVWDYLTRSGFFELMQVADVGLISLSEDFTIPNYPSKTVTYFNARKPVLAAIDLNTDYGNDLEEVGAGFWSHAPDTESLKQKLLQLYEDPKLRKTMGDKGYAYMVAELQVSRAYEKLAAFTASRGFPLS